MVARANRHESGPTKETVLSTLIHRAISMPLQRPQALRDRYGSRFVVETLDDAPLDQAATVTEQRAFIEAWWAERTVQ